MNYENKYFSDEKITNNDLFLMCYMNERVSRKIKQRNKYVVNTIGYDNLYHLISVANVLHSENPLDEEDDRIKFYSLTQENFNIIDVDHDLCETIPSPIGMGSVYTRLIEDTVLPNDLCIKYNTFI